MEDNDSGTNVDIFARAELPPPSTRERPPGCRTVFVGGLPENATDEIIREVFEHCGEITAIRKSKKNFCHIRFSQEFMVDKALYLSGTYNPFRLLQPRRFPRLG